MRRVIRQGVHDGAMRAPLIGIDLVDPGRLEARLTDSPVLAAELFHPGELAYSRGQPAGMESLAARFAAKEAVVKALGMDGFDPLDVEVVDGGEHCSLRLHGEIAKRARELGVTVTISLSHLPNMAAAVAMATSAAAQPRA